MPEEAERIIGIAEDADPTFDESVELGEGGFDADVTIIGYKSDPGGEQRQTADGKSFTTSPQVSCGCRIDNDYAGGTSDYKPIWLRLSAGPGGKMLIKESTKAGYFVTSLRALGVSQDRDEATEFYHTKWSQLVGLRIRLKTEEFANPNRTSETWRVDVPVDFLGFDNEVRETNGLDPVE